MIGAAQGGSAPQLVDHVQIAVVVFRVAKMNHPLDDERVGKRLQVLSLLQGLLQNSSFPKQVGKLKLSTKNEEGCKFLFPNSQKSILESELYQVFVAAISRENL